MKELASAGFLSFVVLVVPAHPRIHRNVYMAEIGFKGPGGPGVCSGPGLA